jgi:ankyrin repeat protein
MSSRDLRDAIQANLVTRVAEIVASGSIDIDEPLEGTFLERNCALTLAASQGRVEIVELLLDAGAGIDRCNALGFTACYVAARNRHTDVVRLLVSRGASLAPRGPNRLSPSHGRDGDKQRSTVARID